jgi:hypothetical protein
LHLPFEAGDLVIEPRKVLLPLRVARRDGDKRGTRAAATILPLANQEVLPVV